MNVLIIGANGRTGQRITQLLLKTKHQPVAMIRNPSQRKKFDELGVPTVLGDKVTITESIHGEGQTRRDHAAATVVACLDRPETIGKSLAVLDGDTPLADALDGLES